METIIMEMMDEMGIDRDGGDGDGGYYTCI